MRRLLRATPRDLEVEAYVRAVEPPLRATTRRLVDLIRDTVTDSRETIHHGTPKFCAGVELFCYVAAHADHVRLGFFEGARLDDPERLLEGTGKRLRFLKVGIGQPVPDAAARLIRQGAEHARASEPASRVRSP